MSNLAEAAAALKAKANQPQAVPVMQTAQPQMAAQPTTNHIRINMDKIQASIKTERNAQGLTQRDLAAKAGMSQGTITRAERHGYISIWCLLRIAHALGKEVVLN